MEHASLEVWFESLDPQENVILISTRGKTALTEADLKPGSHLVFGAESAGLPPSVWDRFGENSVRIPMSPGIRSLNVSVAVGVVLGAAMLRLKVIS